MSADEPPGAGAAAQVAPGPVPVSLVLDLHSPVPPYEQIRAQIAGHITAGHLRHGDRLPSLRALAADLGVAAGTTARAYRELEAAGLVASRRRTGTVVTDTRPPSPHQDAQTAAVLEAAAELARRARRAGWTEQDVITTVRAALMAHTTTTHRARTHLAPQPT